MSHLLGILGGPLGGNLGSLLVDLTLHALGVLGLGDLGVRHSADDVALHNGAADGVLLAHGVLLAAAVLLVKMLLAGLAGHDLAAAGDLVALGGSLGAQSGERQQVSSVPGTRLAVTVPCHQ